MCKLASWKSLCIGGVMLIVLSGCISPKTDAFLLGAGIGAGAATYLFKGGNIGGYSLQSLQNGSRKPTQQYRDFSIPSELEWYYMGEEIFSEMQTQ